MGFMRVVCAYRLRPIATAAMRASCTPPAPGTHLPPTQQPNTASKHSADKGTGRQRTPQRPPACRLVAGEMNRQVVARRARAGLGRRLARVIVGAVGRLLAKVADHEAVAVADHRALRVLSARDGLEPDEQRCERQGRANSNSRSQSWSRSRSRSRSRSPSPSRSASRATGTRVAPDNHTARAPAAPRQTTRLGPSTASAAGGRGPSRRRGS